MNGRDSLGTRAAIRRLTLREQQVGDQLPALQTLCFELVVRDPSFAGKDEVLALTRRVALTRSVVGVCASCKLKMIIDVIRVVCANAESDLAALLAPHMHRPREAKKLLSNLFAAPGKVAVTEHAIHVRLAPAANKSERVAIQHLFDVLNQRGLILPSDPKRLPLRFELAASQA